jgi:hypothetical protein
LWYLQTHTWGIDITWCEGNVAKGEASGDWGWQPPLFPLCEQGELTKHHVLLGVNLLYEDIGTGLLKGEAMLQSKAPRKACDSKLENERMYLGLLSFENFLELPYTLLQGKQSR